jgi:hypothetical protein
VIAVMGGRLERGEPVARMDGPLGLAWLQRQAVIAEQPIRQKSVVDLREQALRSVPMSR